MIIYLATQWAQKYDVENDHGDDVVVDDDADVVAGDYNDVVADGDDDGGPPICGMDTHGMCHRCPK